MALKNRYNHINDLFGDHWTEYSSEEMSEVIDQSQEMGLFDSATSLRLSLIKKQILKHKAAGDEEKELMWVEKLIAVIDSSITKRGQFALIEIQKAKSLEQVFTFAEVTAMFGEVLYAIRKRIKQEDIRDALAEEILVIAYRSGGGPKPERDSSDSNPVGTS